jgi:hypothetical protein
MEDFLVELEMQVGSLNFPANKAGNNGPNRKLDTNLSIELLQQMSRHSYRNTSDN